MLPGASSSNKDNKDLIVTEPIMATPPPAKDFLTYVCFQRNPVFQSLNYLGKPSTATAAPTSANTSPVKQRTSRGSDDDNKPRSGRKTKHVDSNNFTPPVAPGKPTQEDKKSPAPVVKRKPGRPPKVPVNAAAATAPAAVKSESEYETASEHSQSDGKKEEDKKKEKNGPPLLTI